MSPTEKRYVFSLPSQLQFRKKETQTFPEMFGNERMAGHPACTRVVILCSI